MYNKMKQIWRQQEWHEGQKGTGSDESGAYTKGPGTTY